MTSSGRSRVSFPAPRLAQGSDEEALLEIADAMYPGLISRGEGDSRLNLWVQTPGEDHDLGELETFARRRFSECLGALRAMKFGRGELREEVARAPARYASGAVVIRTNTVKVYATFGDQIRQFAEQASGAIAQNSKLRDALELHGKARRDAGDFYSIYEYAKQEFGGREGIRSALGISIRRQKAFTKSANSLSPLEGGRHSHGDPGAVKMRLEEMAEFTATLLRTWIDVGWS